MSTKRLKKVKLTYLEVENMIGTHRFASIVVKLFYMHRYRKSLKFLGSKLEASNRGVAAAHRVSVIIVLSW